MAVYYRVYLTVRQVALLLGIFKSAAGRWSTISRHIWHFRGCVDAAAA